MGANTKLFGICLLVLMNNIAWYYASETKRSTTAHAQDIINKESASQEIATTTIRTTPQATKTAAAKILPQVKKRAHCGKTPAPVTAPRPQELEANLPMRASEDLVADQAFSKETFSFDDQAQKIATIEQLAPKGRISFFAKHYCLQ